ncbi:MAG: penicillin-binding transpeptidase domain-containing protein [Thermaceae bacterium]
MKARILAMIAFFALVFALYGGRLWQLQIIEHETYAIKSQGNYLRTEGIPAPRGRILDRKGRVLAQDRIRVDLVYEGGEILYKRRILALLGLRELPDVREATVLKVGLPEALVPTLAELTAGQKNIRLVERLERHYPRPIPGPVIGYVRRAGPEEVKKGYSPEEEVGAAGLEAALEPYLRGTRGIKTVEVNVRGERLRETILKEPIPGKDVVLTIDLDLQRAAERALVEALEDINRGRALNGLPPVQRARGAVVALDPRTGEILAMATSPSFDPNLLSQRPIPKEARALFSDPDLPLFNRATQAYTPGSTFKLATSYALLEDGYATSTSTYRCTPYLLHGGLVRRNWAARDMGPMTVKEAIAWSCNTWYYQAVLKDPLGFVDRLAQKARLLGLGEATGIETPEKTGLLPTRAWKKEALGEPWYPGETLSLAIGQGYVLASPAQIGRMLATIATGGLKPKLHMVKRIGEEEIRYDPQKVPGRFWSVLQEGLRLTVKNGTASFVLKDFPVPTGGKTGTAETPGKRRGLEHAWYMGYGPAEGGTPYPPLVVVAFFENGGEGSRAALPAAKKVMAAYWKVE